MLCKGIGAAPGYAIGEAFIIHEQKLDVVTRSLSVDEVVTEIQHFEQIVSEAIREVEEIQEKARQELGQDEADILSAQIMVLEDPEYIGEIKETIRARAINAEASVQEVTEKFLKLFNEIDDEYLRERAIDLRDVSCRLLQGLKGVKSLSIEGIPENAILIAHDLSPSDTAQLSADKVGGIVTEIGGRTSHSAIMAHSMGIPAVVGLQSIVGQVKTGECVIVDGIEGKVYLNPVDSVIQEYSVKKDKFEARHSNFKKLVNEETVTQDGLRIQIGANIGNPQDAKVALANGAEGIGLYRTEFLYMGKTELPSEEEQFLAYKEVATMFGKQPVVIRTLDIGGDKELPYLNMPKETNPFLGYRAIRLCLGRIEIFRTQLRAILRASDYGNIKIMFPMIATLEELRAANRVLEEAKQELTKANIAFDTNIEVGIMVEIPATAILADQFAKEVDFFSIGTNDLVQYTMAADRLNEKVSYLYQPFNPSVLRLIKGVIIAAHQEGKWVGMCGEMAGDLMAIPILLGLGLDEFSMSASSILPVRFLVRQLTQEKAAKIAQAIFNINSAEDIRHFVEQELSSIDLL